MLTKFRRQKNRPLRSESTIDKFHFKTSALYINEYRAKRFLIPPADDTISFLITDTAYQFQY